MAIRVHSSKVPYEPDDSFVGWLVVLGSLLTVVLLTIELVRNHVLRKQVIELGGKPLCYLAMPVERQPEKASHLATTTAKITNAPGSVLGMAPLCADHHNACTNPTTGAEMHPEFSIVPSGKRYQPLANGPKLPVVGEFLACFPYHTCNARPGAGSSTQGAHGSSHGRPVSSGGTIA